MPHAEQNYCSLTRTQALKTAVADEKVAMRSQLSEMEQRLTDAKAKLTELRAADAKVGSGAPPMCEQLVGKGTAYAKSGKYKYASLMFMSAVKLMESIGLGRSKHVVAPVSEKMRALKAKLRTLQVPGGGNSDGSAVEREQRRSDATRAKQPLPRRSRAEQGARQGKGLERPRDESGETGPRAARRAPRASLGGSLGGSHRPRSHLPTRTYF